MNEIDRYTAERVKIVREEIDKVVLDNVLYFFKKQEMLTAMENGEAVEPWMGDIFLEEL